MLRVNDMNTIINGCNKLTEMCEDSSTAIIAVQEHWFRPENLRILNSHHSSFLELVYQLCVTNYRLRLTHAGRPLVE
jgi:aromatic ring-opening dioxygenase catalytic subunit (LigB family)